MKQVIELGLFFILAVLSISSYANQDKAFLYGDSLFVECQKKQFSDGVRYVISYAEGSYFEWIPPVDAHCANSISLFLRKNVNVRPLYVEQVDGTFYYWFLAEDQ